MIDIYYKELNKYIEIFNLVSIDDLMGGQCLEWQYDRRMLAKIKPLVDLRLLKSQLFENNKPTNHNYYEITTRFDTKINHDSRVRYKDKWLNVLRVVDVEEMGKWLILIVEEVI